MEQFELQKPISRLCGAPKSHLLDCEPFSYSSLTTTEQNPLFQKNIFCDVITLPLYSLVLYILNIYIKLLSATAQCKKKTDVYMNTWQLGCGHLPVVGASDMTSYLASKPRWDTELSDLNLISTYWPVEMKGPSWYLLHNFLTGLESAVFPLYTSSTSSTHPPVCCNSNTGNTTLMWEPAGAVISHVQLWLWTYVPSSYLGLLKLPELSLSLTVSPLQTNDSENNGSCLTLC